MWDEREQPRPVTGNEVVAESLGLGSRNQNSEHRTLSSDSVAAVIDLAQWKARKSGSATPLRSAANRAVEPHQAAHVTPQTQRGAAAAVNHPSIPADVPGRAVWRVTWRFVNCRSRQRSFRSRQAALAFFECSLSGYGENLAWCTIAHRLLSDSNWTIVYTTPGGVR